ncbi:MAG: amidophosphoribosyltransferase [Lentisphaeria bacterium]
MSGFFGVASRADCVTDLFYGVDYHSHLGTRRGGLAVLNGNGFIRHIHDISNAQFRSKFEHDLCRFKGNSGIGVISDHEDQPLLIGSHLGSYAIVTVGVITNAGELIQQAFRRRAFFSEMTGDEINPTELVAMLINQEDSFAAGLQRVQAEIQGSCSVLLLTADGIYAARDRYGRTPVILGEKAGAQAVTFESCAFPNLGYRPVRDLGPGEIVRITPDGTEVLAPPGEVMQVCSFLWVYYGYPSSSYEGVNVEQSRYRCGELLARRDTVEVDGVAGIPDSGTAHAIGYANAARLPQIRPFVKYTPTWPRSFMPQDQSVRELVARMKLVPIPELIRGRRLLFCEDSIVRGTQLRDTIQTLYDAGAREVHMRPACPPLAYPCPFLNFSRSRSEMDLAARRAVAELEGKADDATMGRYLTPGSGEYEGMVNRIGERLRLSTLRYQTLPDLVGAIGLPREKLCTYCWSGTGVGCPGCPKTTAAAPDA